MAEADADFPARHDRRRPRRRRRRRNRLEGDDAVIRVERRHREEDDVNGVGVVDAGRDRSGKIERVLLGGARGAAGRRADDRSVVGTLMHVHVVIVGRNGPRHLETDALAGIGARRDLQRERVAVGPLDTRRLAVRRSAAGVWSVPGDRTTRRAKSTARWNSCMAERGHCDRERKSDREPHQVRAARRYYRTDLSAVHTDPRLIACVKCASQTWGTAHSRTSHVSGRHGGRAEATFVLTLARGG